MPLDVFLNRLLCALVAGFLIGAERQLRKKSAGGKQKSTNTEQGSDSSASKPSAKKGSKAGSGAKRPASGQGSSGHRSTGGHRGSRSGSGTQTSPETAPALPGTDSPVLQG